MATAVVGDAEFGCGATLEALDSCVAGAGVCVTGGGGGELGGVVTVAEGVGDGSADDATIVGDGLSVCVCVAPPELLIVTSGVDDPPITVVVPVVVVAVVTVPVELPGSAGPFEGGLSAGAGSCSAGAFPAWDGSWFCVPESSASASPGLFATANPTPSATASAPPGQYGLRIP